MAHLVQRGHDVVARENTLSERHVHLAAKKGTAPRNAVVSLLGAREAVTVRTPVRNGTWFEVTKVAARAVPLPSVRTDSVSALRLLSHVEQRAFPTDEAKLPVKMLWVRYTLRTVESWP